MFLDDKEDEEVSFLTTRIVPAKSIKRFLKTNPTLSLKHAHPNFLQQFSVGIALDPEARLSKHFAQLQYYNYYYVHPCTTDRVEGAQCKKLKPGSSVM